MQRCQKQLSSSVCIWISSLNKHLYGLIKTDETLSTMKGFFTKSRETHHSIPTKP